MTDPAGVDASVLVRYFVQDDPERGPAASRLLDGAELVHIGGVALLETAGTLESVYRVPRADIVDALVDLIAKQNVQLLGLDKTVVAGALQMCRPSRRVSFGDALINAEARSHSLRRVYTFDRRFLADGIQPVSPT